MSVKSQNYTTVGGWIARVVFVSTISHLCYVIHKPDTREESIPIAHNKYDGRAQSILSVGEPPRFDKQHPADLVIPLE